MTAGVTVGPTENGDILTFSDEILTGKWPNIS